MGFGGKIDILAFLGIRLMYEENRGQHLNYFAFN